MNNNSFPKIMIDEWDYEKNKNLRLTDFLPYSNKKVWWKCSVCGHEWSTTIGSRYSGSGCRECGKAKSIQNRIKNKIAINGSLQDNNPFLASEWNYEKNGDLKPSDVLPNSNIKVWWICPKGHEWQAQINERNSGRGCKECAKERGSSFPEQAIFYYLGKQCEAINRYKYKGQEVDVFLPGLNIAIEYDGEWFHSSERSKKREKEKTPS